MNSPIAIADVGLREQPTLDARCKLEIAFQSALFFAAEVIEAQAHEWINDEPFLLNGIVTDVAYPIRSFIHSPDREIHVLKKLVERSGRVRGIGKGNCGDRDLETIAAFFELFAKIGIGDSGHSFILRFRD